MKKKRMKGILIIFVLAMMVMSGSIAYAKKDKEVKEEFDIANQEYLARLYLQYEKYDQAIEIYKNIMAKSPVPREVREAQFVIAYIYTLQGKYDQAATIYQKFIEEKEGPYQKIKEARKKYEKALKAYQEAMKESPEKRPEITPMPHIPMVPEGEMPLEEVGKDLTRVRFALAKIYETQGKYDLALEAYQKILKEAFLETRAPGIYPAIPLEMVRRPMESLPSSGEILISIAKIYEIQKDYDKAIETYKRIIATKNIQEREIAIAQFFLAGVYELKGKSKEAAAIYKGIIETAEKSKDFDVKKLATIAQGKIDEMKTKK